MKFFPSSGKPGEVPFYTKAGWVLAWLLMLVLLLMIAHNCASSINYGGKTGAVQVALFYQQGLRDGSAGRADALPAEAAENPVLRKAYSKGYREGLDQRRTKSFSKD